MKTIIIPIFLLSILLLVSQNSFANGRLSDVDRDIKKGVIEINELMVDRNRDEALESINEVSSQLRGKKYEPEFSVYQNLERLEFYLRKTEWVMARRILKSLMTDMDLEYQPTYE